MLPNGIQLEHLATCSSSSLQIGEVFSPPPETFLAKNALEVISRHLDALF
jgi:hypothetical protein